MKIHAFWGVKDLDRDNVDHWDPAQLGKAILDKDLDLSTFLAQKSLLNFCKDLRK